MEEAQRLDMDEKVTVFNIAPWNVGFPNSVGRGDTCFAPNARVRVRREELADQVSAGNRLLAGLDDHGSHATLYIEDEATRKYLEFDSEDGKRRQNVISKDRVKKWLELKTFSAFKKNVQDNVKTRAEKRYLLKCLKDLKADSHERIEFCKEYCKFTLRGM